MLLEDLQAMAAHRNGLTHVLALDPARDGLAIEDIPVALTTGIAAGLIAGPERPTATLADWMVHQERFQAHFRPLARTEHASDQMPLAEWLSCDAKGRERSTPVVMTGAGADASRWIPDAAIVAQSERWWSRLQQMSPSQPAQSPAVPDGGSTEPPQAPPAAASDADIHERLTERLLALSGFQHGGSSLQAWLAERLTPTADENA